MDLENIKRINLNNVLPVILIVTGLVGLLASFALTYDKIQILQNPSYEAGCNINPILSCGSVMSSEQATVLGVPNTLFGLISFSMLIAFGFMLLAGAKMQRWIWIAAQIAATAGLIFMHYLFFQGVYRINAICPWCFTVWMVTIPAFWYLTLCNLREGHIGLPKRWKRTGQFLQDNHGNILFVWYVVIFLILLTRFWYYWQTLI